MVYVFRKLPSNINWVKQLQSKGKIIYFIDRSFFSKKIKYNNISCLMGIIKKEKVDIIHTHFVAYNFTLLFLKLFIKKVKIIGHFHNNFIYPRNIFTVFKVFANKFTFDLYIGVNASVAEGLIRTGFNSDKVTSVPNAIDFNRLNISEQIQLKTNKTQKVILMFGWDFYRKGMDSAIKAVRNVRELGFDVILVVSLAGGKESIAAEIIKICGNIPEWIFFLEARNDVATYYNATDIFLSASREEGLNYSVIEAAYSNSMVLVSNIPGNPQDVPAVFVHDAGNAEQLSHSIIEALNKSNEEKVQMKMLQRQYVKEKYDLNTWSREILNIYKN